MKKPQKLKVKLGRKALGSDPKLLIEDAIATPLEDEALARSSTPPPPNPNPNPNPIKFSAAVKQQCWDKAYKINGRDPDRWREDALGNLVFQHFYRCSGCLCHDYHPIVPQSQGGNSTLENCQVLQATTTGLKWKNKGMPISDLNSSTYCRVGDREMDQIERFAYGNVRRGPDSGGCNIQ